MGVQDIRFLTRLGLGTETFARSNIVSEVLHPEHGRRKRHFLPRSSCRGGLHRPLATSLRHSSSRISHTLPKTTLSQTRTTKKNKKKITLRPSMVDNWWAPFSWKPRLARAKWGLGFGAHYQGPQNKKRNTRRRWFACRHLLA